MGVNGGAMLFPLYRDGVILEPSTAQRLAVRSGIRFPVYADVDTALARERALHKIMEEDSRAFMKSENRR